MRIGEVGRGTGDFPESEVSRRPGRPCGEERDGRGNKPCVGTRGDLGCQTSRKLRPRSSSVLTTLFFDTVDVQSLRGRYT